MRPGWQTPVVKSLVTGSERAYPTPLTLRDEPMWTADGNGLLFAMPPEGSVGEAAGLVWQFVRLDLANGAFEEIGQAAGRGLVRLAGNQGATLTYLLNDYGEKPFGRLLALDLKSRTTTELHRVDGTTFSDAVLSADGKIAFALPQTAEGSGLFVKEPGSASKSIGIVRPNARAQLAWFPSADAVLVSGRLNKQAGLWRVPVDGLAPTKLVFDATNVTEVRMSPDAQRIAYTVRVTRPNEVWAYKGILPHH